MRGILKMKRNANTPEAAIKIKSFVEDGIGYKYELFMRESSMVASCGIPLYSISVEMTQGDGKVTKAHTKDLFSDIGKATEFFEKLVNNLATPIDLPYVVEDELSR